MEAIDQLLPSPSSQTTMNAPKDKYSPVRSSVSKLPSGFEGVASYPMSEGVLASHTPTSTANPRYYSSSKVTTGPVMSSSVSIPSQPLVSQYSTKIGGQGYYKTGYSSSVIGQPAMVQQTSTVMDQSYAGRSFIGEASVKESKRYTVAGSERVLETRQFVDESRTTVIGERCVEHEVRIPKKIVVEETVERVVVIPEKRIREEIIEDVAIVKEKFVDVQKPIIQEKIVEVPEIEYVEKIIEVPEIIVQEKLKEVPKIEIQERIIEVPKIIEQEKLVEVPEIQYRDVPVERIEEVPEIHEQVVVKEIPVPQYVDKPYPEYYDVEDIHDIDRHVPIPVEAITTFEFKLPQIRPYWKKLDIPVYVPRFVEVPIPMDLMAKESMHEADRYAEMVATLSLQSAPSLCEIEKLGKSVRADYQNMVASQDITGSVIRALQAGTLQVTGTFSATTHGAPQGMVVSGGGMSYTVTGGTTTVHSRTTHAPAIYPMTYGQKVVQSMTPLYSGVQGTTATDLQNMTIKKSKKKSKTKKSKSHRVEA